MPKPRNASKVTFPYTFEKNGRTGKIYKLGNGTFKTSFTFAGESYPNTFASFENAYGYLDREFSKLDTDRANSLALNALNGDVRNYSELEQLLRNEGGGASLRDAVSFYLANWKLNSFSPQTYSSCFAGLIVAKEHENLTKGQIGSLKKHCGRFEKDFGERMVHEITALEITNWLATRTDEDTGRPWSVKTRQNALGSLVTLSLYAQKVAGAIPKQAKTAFQNVTKPKSDVKQVVDIYTPSELESLLQTAIATDADMIPIVAIGCFAGLRPFEIHAEGLKPKRSPLDWSAFNWNDDKLHVTGQKVRSKKTRDIDVCPALKAWLAPLVKESGPLWQYNSNHSKKLLSLRKASGVRSIYDGFRHSFASYRIRQLKQSLTLLAAEMGNSPDEIENSYKRNVGDKDAEKWFAVMPPADYADKLRALRQAC